MVRKPSASPTRRSPVFDLPRPEPQLEDALANSETRVVSWLGRLYGGSPVADDTDTDTGTGTGISTGVGSGTLHGLEVPFEHESAHLNPADVLMAFIHAARAGRERNDEAIAAGAPIWKYD